MGKIVSDFIQGNLFKGDKVVWMIYFFLCMISLVEVYSASSSLTYDSGNHWEPMIKQAVFLFIGLLVILVSHKIPCKMYMLIGPFLLAASIILLLYTSLHAGAINNANRWLNLGPISFQPSEMAKAGLIMTVAVVLAKTQAERVVMKNGKEVMDLLTELNKEGTTIVMVTHSQKDASCAQRVVNLFDGEIVSDVKNEL